MQELSIRQTQQISGGSWSLVFKIAFTTFITIGNYIIHQKDNREKVTVEGLAIAAGSGMIEGSVKYKNKTLGNSDASLSTHPSLHF